MGNGIEFVLGLDFDFLDRPEYWEGKKDDRKVIFCGWDVYTRDGKIIKIEKVKMMKADWRRRPK